MPENLPKWDDPGFWTGRGCVVLGGAFVALLGVAVAGVSLTVRQVE